MERIPAVRGVRLNFADAIAEQERLGARSFVECDGKAVLGSLGRIATFSNIPTLKICSIWPSNRSLSVGLPALGSELREYSWYRLNRQAVGVRTLTPLRCERGRVTIRRTMFTSRT